jgi:hypothetical protein
LTGPFITPLGYKKFGTPLDAICGSYPRGYLTNPFRILLFIYLFIYCASLPNIIQYCIKEAGTPQQLNTNYSGPFTKYQYKYRKQK